MQNASRTLSAGLSMLEIDSGTDLSLPSPTTSGSMDDTGSLSPSPHNPCVSVRVGVGILPHNLNNTVAVATSSQPPLTKYSPFVNKISAKVW